jgi:hypothetical protein
MRGTARSIYARSIAACMECVNPHRLALADKDITFARLPISAAAAAHCVLAEYKFYAILLLISLY